MVNWTYPSSDSFKLFFMKLYEYLQKIENRDREKFLHKKCKKTRLKKILWKCSGIQSISFGSISCKIPDQSQNDMLVDENL
jgi:ribosomal protein L37AE/L43A